MDDHQLTWPVIGTLKSQQAAPHKYEKVILQKTVFIQPREGIQSIELPYQLLTMIRKTLNFYRRSICTYIYKVISMIRLYHMHIPVIFNYVNGQDLFH